LIENNENKIEMKTWAPAGKCILKEQKKKEKENRQLFDFRRR